MTETVYTYEADLPAGGELALELHHDRVTLAPWDRDAVEVRVLEGDPRRLRLTAGRRGARLHRADGGAALKLEIRAPRRLTLRLLDDASRVRLAGFEGRFDLHTAGDLEAEGLQGHVSLDAGGGEQRFVALAGRFDVTCRGGVVRLAVAGLDGDSRLAAESGRIDVDLATGVDASFTNDVWRPWRRMHFRADMGEGGPTVKVSARRGEVRLFRQGTWKSTLRRDGEVRLAGWDKRRRRFLHELAARVSQVLR